MSSRAEPDGAPAPRRPEPVGTGERIETIDVLRGFAILGILVVNIGDMSFPLGHHAIFDELFGSLPDRLVVWASTLLVEGKLYTMFSFLFGIGIAIQLERARARGTRFAPWHARRLLVLLVIGLMHDVLIWSGLILITYALVGFLVLPFLHRRKRTLLIWAIVLVMSPPLIVTALSSTRHSSPPAAEGEQASGAVAEETSPEEREAAAATESRETFEQDVALFAEGSYLDQVRYRVSRLPRTFAILLAMGWYILGMFLFGLLSWRVGAWRQLESSRTLLRRTALWCLPIGFLLAGVFLGARIAIEGRPAWPALAGFSAAHHISNVTLCLGYVSLLALAMRTATGRRLLRPLVAVGRTALSNYILQSLVCTTIFYSHGLGLFGQVGPAVNLLIVILVFALQLSLSAWWVERFRFGPAEWAWRSLSYGRIMRLR